MSAAAAPAANTMRPKPFGLIRAEILKLRKRRGLVVTVGLMTLGIQVVVFGIIAILHAVNPDHHGPAGGLDNLGGGAGALGWIGSVAAIIVGATAGSGDLGSGVFRELVVTGRSRLDLFLARVPGGLIFMFAFVAVSYTLIAVVSAEAAGSLPSPSVGLLIEVGVWVVANVSFYYVLGLGLGSLLGSRGTTIGILLAWRLLVANLVAGISFLGFARKLVPNSAFTHFVPHLVRNNMGEVDKDLHMSAVTALVVIAAWTAVWLAVGAWRTATRDV
jgi:hypothetical protein